eukprot:9654003-Alexandrium_andersonii.AAC.1
MGVSQMFGCLLVQRSERTCTHVLFGCTPGHCAFAHTLSRTTSTHCISHLPTMGAMVTTTVIAND